MKKNRFAIEERLDPDKNTNEVEKYLHQSRYQLASELLKKHTGAILDVACGTGYGTHYLYKQLNRKIIGVDVDKETVSVAQKKLRIKGRLEFVNASITGLPFPDKSFQSIICFETIEHVTGPEGEKALKELCRVLKRGGTLIISSPNVYYTGVMKLIQPSYHNPFHLHEYYIDELRGSLDQLGFTGIKIYCQYPFFPPLYLIAQKINFLRPFFSPTKYIPAKLCRYFILTASK